MFRSITEFGLVVVGAATLLASPAASAQSYTVTATGTVNTVYAGTSTSDGSVHVGDAFNAILNLSTSELTSNITSMNGDSSGVYGFPLTYTFSAGHFSISGNSNSPTLVIFDNHVFSPSFTGDSIGFSIFGPFSSNTPFTFSTPGAYSSFSLGGYDTTSATIPDVSLSEFTELNAFPNKNASINFSSSDFSSGGLIQASLNSIVVSQVGAVPEPATWAMMIAGFGMVGARLRYRKRRTVLRYA